MRPGDSFLSLLCRIALICLVAGGLLACNREGQSDYQHEVEIAPNRWLVLHEKRGKCWFYCDWNGKRVVWDGKRDRTDELELPKVIREHEGNLYMVVLNRENMDAIKFVYYKLGERGERFAEIPSNEFPKSIATENIVGPQTRMVGVNNALIDSWEVLRKLDIESPYFSRCTTADIWIELETGKTLPEISKNVAYEERKRIIRDFNEKHHPIPLPHLVKEVATPK